MIVTIIPIYNEDQYEKLLVIIEDRSHLPNSYADWRKATDALMYELSDGGFGVFPVDVDLDEVVGWCAANRLKINHSNLIEFVAFKFDAAGRSAPRGRYVPRG